MDIITRFSTYFTDYLQNITMNEGIAIVVIALIFGIVVTRFVGLILMPALAAVVYIAADAVIPPLLHHTSIVMPMFDKALLKEAIALYVIFLVAIIVVFALKKAVRGIFG